MMWREIPYWPYSVSENGVIRNDRSGRILKQRSHKSGYLEVQLWKDGVYKNFGVHRLVAICFIGEPPSEMHEVAHDNGNRHDNRFTNLKWSTHLENMDDRDRHGTTAINKTNGKTKYDDSLVACAKALIRSGSTLKEAAGLTGIHAGTLSGYVYCGRRAYIK